MNKTTVSPFVVSEFQAVELTNSKGVKKQYWKKEILPSGTKDYKGTKLDFSKINPACVKAFSEKATGPSVPFVLALADNKHPEPGQELENLEGELHRLELGAKGELIGYFDLTHSDKVPGLIAKTNGKFGVSGRIEVDYVPGDDQSKKYEYALSHVCGTTRPHIKELAPWEAVELSEEEKKREVIDFSTEVIDETKPEDKEDGLVTVNMPQDQVDKLMAFIKQQEEADAAAKKFLDGANGGDGDKPVAELSEAAQNRIELAETSAREAFTLAEKAQIRAAETEWQAKRKMLLSDGVPPVILDLAESVLKLHKPVAIELSDKTTIDASAVIDKILDECKGIVKLSQEDGHSVTDAGSGPADDKDFDEFEKSFLANFGLQGGSN